MARAVWLLHAGTMGLVMRDGINRLGTRRYSICSRRSARRWRGQLEIAGTSKSPDPIRARWPVRPRRDLGTTRSTRGQRDDPCRSGRKERGAKIVAIDIYRNGTMEQADLALCLRPGTDGALACAVMHVLFRDGYANWPYMERYTDCPRELEAHLRTRTPEWASAITGLSVEEIETFARMIGTTPRTYLRLGYGFSRQRNGAINMHAASCIASVTGSWLHEGGGAFHNNGAIFHWDKTMIEGLDVRDPSVRVLDMSRIGPVLTGNPYDIGDGPPITALFIQNMNPVQVAPEQRQKGSCARTCSCGTNSSTPTAQMADIVLPATMFLEHDDLYQAGGQQSILFGPKLIEPPGECRSNHDVIVELAKRVGARHPGFEMTPRELIDWTLRKSGWGTLEELEEEMIIASRISRPRTSSTGSVIPTGNLGSGPTGPMCRSGAGTIGACRTCRQHCPTIGT